MMDKPVSVALAELRERLAAAINDSRLPPVIAEPVLRDVWQAAAQAAQQQTAAEKEAWDKERKQAQEVG